MSFIPDLPHGNKNTFNFRENLDIAPSYKSVVDKVQLFERPNTSTASEKVDHIIVRTSVGTLVPDEVITGSPDYPDDEGINPSKGSTEKPGSGPNNTVSNNKVSNNNSKHTSKKGNSTSSNSRNLIISEGRRVDTFDLDEGSYVSDTTPLYLMNGHFFSFSEASSYANEEFDNVITKYINALQHRSNYDIGKNIDKAKFLAFIKCFVQSMELYLFLTSVVDYTNSNIFGNRGLNHIRSKISVDDIYDLDTLKNLLETFYVNPNLVTFLKSMYGNYSTNPSKYCPMIKLCPQNLFLEDLNNVDLFKSGETIKNKIDELRKYYYVSSIFKKFNSNWKVDLSSFDTRKRHDTSFLSFWHNNTITYCEEKSKLTVTTSRIIDGLKSEAYLGIFSDSVKGEMMSSIAIKEFRTGIIETGIYIPSTNYPVDMDFVNRTSLHVYSADKGIIGINTLNDANMSFIYATPYAKDSNSYEVLNSKYQSREIRDPSLSLLRRFVHQTIHYLFLT